MCVCVCVCVCVSLYKNKYTQYNLLLYNFVLYKQKLLFWMPSTIFFLLLFLKVMLTQAAFIWLKMQ